MIRSLTVTLAALALSGCSLAGALSTDPVKQMCARENYNGVSQATAGFTTSGILALDSVVHDATPAHLAVKPEILLRYVGVQR